MTYIGQDNNRLQYELRIAASLINAGLCALFIAVFLSVICLALLVQQPSAFSPSIFLGTTLGLAVALARPGRPAMFYIRSIRRGPMSHYEQEIQERISRYGRWYLVVIAVSPYLLALTFSELSHAPTLPATSISELAVGALCAFLPILALCWAFRWLQVALSLLEDLRAAP